MAHGAWRCKMVLATVLAVFMAVGAVVGFLTEDWDA